MDAELSAAGRLTPARRQYLEIKAQCPPDSILLYRLGDFYETFDDDAHRVAEALHITLTSREFGRGVRVPLAGIPHHALNSYLGRLLSRGFKVAIAEQLSEPGPGIVERGVVRLITPGTVAQPELLQAAENSYLAAVCGAHKELALAYVDVTTGEFCVTLLDGEGTLEALEAELARLAPAETLLPAGSLLPFRGTATYLEERHFEPESAAELLCRSLRVSSLEAFGCAGSPAAIGAAGAIVSYLERTSPDLLNLLTGFSTSSAGRFLVMDPQTRRNLDLVRGGRGGSAKASLLACLDQTRTPMGSRLLRRMLGQPLLDPVEIAARLDNVEALYSEPARRRRLGTALDRIADLERLTGRVCQGSAGRRDCLLLAAALQRVGVIAEAIGGSPALAGEAAALDPLAEVIDLLTRAVSEQEGRLVRRGFDAQLDGMLDSIDGAQRGLLELERAERERTAIRSLRVGYTRVFGYYIEVTRPNLKLVPADYRHKQTLANATRFTTPELKQHEEELACAEEGAVELEQALFAAVLQRVASRSERLLRTAGAVARLDVYLSLAEVAATKGYVRPLVDSSVRLELSAGRHAIVEERLPAGEFVANDCALDGEGCQIALVTGPNMAGKSTFLRQVALCTVMAQIGSFVPAAAARLGVVDRIFTRIGAQDDIAAGASTFMVEMIETATILRHATRRSLVLLDEVGRGTGTHDGLAIAQAVVEYLHHYAGARTLFATHFHELTALALTLPRLRTFNVAAIEDAGRPVFLHRVLPGASDRSYGVQVAKLAGIPPMVAARAEKLLRALDRRREVAASRSEASAARDGVLDELAALDVLHMSPLEAQARLVELQARLNGAARSGDPTHQLPRLDPEAERDAAPAVTAGR